MLIVLAIENPDLRLSMELLLSQEPGVEIVGGASESAGLLALVRSSRPDLVVMSWDLPGSPNKKILEDLHDQDATATIMVMGESQYKNEALTSGADAFITRGESPDLLIETFRRLRKEKGFLSQSKEFKG